MAVPKGKVSKARRDKRRSSHWKLAAPGLVKRDDRVLERRSVRIVHDGVDLSLRLGDGLLEGGQIMLRADLVEPGRAVRQRGVCKQWIHVVVTG